MGIPKMDARFAARMATGLSLAILSLAVLRGEALAQYYPPGPYTPVAPGHRPMPLDDDEDLPSQPAPGPYSRPSNAPYPYDTPPPRGPSSIQSEALPPPGPSPYRAGSYQEGGPPPSRGFSYGNWEPIRPPGDMYAPNDRTLPPGPGRSYDYANRPPIEITP